MCFCIYKYPRPMVTVDCLLITEINAQMQILLISRKKEPFKDMWALPGGFVEMNEDLPQAVKRELMEETGIICNNLEQFKTYGTPGRDPRGRCISIVYTAKVESNSIKIKAGDDATLAQWFSVDSLPQMAFDHALIVSDFLKINSTEQ